MKIALITGASSGLGREYLKAVCERYRDLDEIWIIARREKNLIELKNAYPDRTIVPFTADLNNTDSFDLIGEALKKKNATVSLLINNAGLGKIGNLADMPREGQTEMVDLNCRALTAMCSTVLPYMKKGSKIINVCSIASFVPNPRMTVYSATKAYVMSFSRSLRFELKEKGINVLAVCPCPMTTEFLSVAGIEKGTSKTFDTLPRVSPEAVARRSLEKSDKGRSVYTPLLLYKVYRVIAKLVPHGLMMKIAKT